MKINILGASGSGVTTTGKRLALLLGIPYFDSDQYFWMQTDPPFTTRRISSERNRLIKDDLTITTNWILGGSVIDWGDDVFPEFNLIVFLYLPRDIRMQRLIEREHERYGDVIHTDPGRKAQFEKFIGWAADYDQGSGIVNRTQYAHDRWLETQTSPIIRLEGDLTTNERIELIVEKIEEI